ncbi:MAG: carboxypeptidase-like regulatory domain-containing protein [Defluviitaleaceae bacterium]|nr:carboxypeptidase-like regulatory domain-containing protein [Defluviitaleaceae bacterium]
MEMGYLKVQTFMGEYLFPVAGAKIIVKCGEGNVLYELYTDKNGLSERIPLPASEHSRRYTVEISHDGGFRRTIVHGVEIFPGITSTLPVQMQPATDNLINDNEIFIPYKRGADLENRFAPEKPEAVKLNFETAALPDYIIVHMGCPDESAENLKLLFKDYIKETH